MAGAAVLLAAGTSAAQEPAKQKQLPTPKEVVGQIKGATSWFTTRDWHAGPGYGYGPFPGYGGGYYAPFYMGYYPGYGMGYFGYDWSPARMRITEINLDTALPPGAPNGKGKAGDSTARAMVLAVKEWTNGKTFTDTRGRRWKLCHGSAPDARPMALSGWLLTADDGTQTFFTASGRLFCLEAAPEKKKG
jgi:hypothetical protein